MKTDIWIEEKIQYYLRREVTINDGEVVVTELLATSQDKQTILDWFENYSNDSRPNYSHLPSNAIEIKKRTIYEPEVIYNIN